MEDQCEHIQGQREHFTEDSGVTPLGKKTLVNTPHSNVMHHIINTSIRMLIASGEKLKKTYLAGLYIIEFKKGLKMGKEKGNLGKIKLLTVLNHRYQ